MSERDNDGFVVLRHPVLAPIANGEVREVLREGADWVDVRVEPTRLRLAELWEADWDALVAVQTEQVRNHEAVLRAASRIAYFGMAPIPLAMHLGFLVERTVPTDVYQRHHTSERWGWSTDEALEPLALRDFESPDHGSRDSGPVVLRVSTSHRVDPALTRGVVSGVIFEADLGLKVTGEDAFRTQSQMRAFIERFSQVIAELRRLFPNMSALHLFAAVPVGLAFRMGTQINPTIYPPVVTYQFSGRAKPPYRRAVILGDLQHSPLPTRSDGVCLTSLRSQLVDLYPQQRDARRLLADAEVDTARIDLNGAPITMWHFILEEVRHQKRIEQLVAIARSEYPQVFGAT